MHLILYEIASIYLDDSDSISQTNVDIAYTYYITRVLSGSEDV